MNLSHLIRFLIAGKFHRDFIITSSGKTHFDIPGGGLPYAATGFRLWENGMGLISQVGENFPQDWLMDLAKYDLDIRGIKILPQTIDLRAFIFHLEDNHYETTNPIAQFAKLGIPIPKSLLGYIPSPSDTKREKSRNAAYIANQLPGDYMDATAAHICPLDPQIQKSLIASFQEGHINTISLDPEKSYMKASAWETLPGLLENIHIFHVSEEKLSTLFRGRETDIWQMVENLAQFGLEVITVKRGKEGQYVYDCYGKKRWLVPAYPSRTVDLTGSGDSFCGGFLAGFRKSYDPVEAALHGNVSASLSIEGTGPYYTMQVLPGLAGARLEKLRGMVKQL